MDVRTNLSQDVLAESRIDLQGISVHTAAEAKINNENFTPTIRSCNEGA